MPVALKPCLWWLDYHNRRGADVFVCANPVALSSDRRAALCRPDATVRVQLGRSAPFDVSAAAVLERYDQRAWAARDGEVLAQVVGRTKDAVSRVARLQLDLDDVDVALPDDGAARRRPAADAAIPRLRHDVVIGVLPPPNIVVETSPSRYQLLWNLRAEPAAPASGGPFPLRGVAEAFNALLAARYDGDPAVVPVSQVVRVPGFYNRKPDHGPVAPLARRVPLQPARWPSPPEASYPDRFDGLQAAGVVSPQALQDALAKAFDPRLAAEQVPERQAVARRELDWQRAAHLAEAAAAGVAPLTAREIAAGGPALAVPAPVAYAVAASPAPLPSPPGAPQRSRSPSPARAVGPVASGVAVPRVEAYVGRDGAVHTRTRPPSPRELGRLAGLHDGAPAVAARSSRERWYFAKACELLEDGVAVGDVVERVAEWCRYGADRRPDPVAYAARTVRSAHVRLHGVEPPAGLLPGASLEPAPRPAPPPVASPPARSTRAR